MTKIAHQVPFYRVLIRMPNWIGDAVMATPVIAEIKKVAPHAVIDLLCQNRISELFKHDPSVNTIYTYNKSHALSFLNYKTWTLTDKLAASAYDLGLLLTNSFSSAWLMKRSKVLRRVGYGVTFFRRRLLTHFSNHTPFKQEHQIDSYLKLLYDHGIAEEQENHLHLPYLITTAQEDRDAKRFLPASKKIIMIHASAAYGSAKRWPESSFIQVVTELLQHDSSYHLVMVGDTRAHPFAQSIIKNASVDDPNRIHNQCGKTSLRELIALIKHADLFISNDSGPMHIASAFHVPTVAIFGSTSPEKTRPRHASAKTMYAHAACSPCFKRECPIDLRCMTAIRPQDVLDAALRLLEGETTHNSLPLINTNYLAKVNS